MDAISIATAPITKAGEEISGFFHGLLGHPEQSPQGSPAQAPAVGSSYQPASPEEDENLKFWKQYVQARDSSMALESRKSQTGLKQQDMLDSALKDLTEIGSNPPKDRAEYDKKLDAIEFKLAAAEGRVPYRYSRGGGQSTLRKQEAGISGKDIPDELDFAGTPIDKSGKTLYTRYSTPDERIVYMPSPAVAGQGHGSFADLMRAYDIVQHPDQHTTFEVSAAKTRIAQAQLQATPGEHTTIVYGPGSEGDLTAHALQVPDKGTGKPKITEIPFGKIPKNVTDAKNDLNLVKLRLKDAESHALERNNPGDLILLENYMQLAFGQSPKGIRGSPAWFTQMEQIVRGSLGQRWAAEVNALAGKGLLSETARQEALRAVRDSARNRITADQEVIDAAGASAGPAKAPQVGGTKKSVDAEVDALKESFGLKKK